MSSVINDGGSAFPHDRINHAGFAAPRLEAHEGMSLRDWFAGQAINGLVVGLYYPDICNDAKKIAVVAYWLADAMLAERAKERK